MGKSPLPSVPLTTPMLPPPPQRARDRRGVADLLRRAQAALGRGGTREAIELLQRASALDPADAEPAFHLGNLLAVQGETAAAIAAYEQALQSAPEHAELRVNLGITLGQAGNAAGAERCFNEVLRRAPAHAGALGNLAHALFARAAYAAALAHYERLLTVVRDAGAEIWNNRGVCLQHLGERAGAEQSFRRALALEPDAAAIVANLGLLLYDGGHLDAAKPVLERAHALDPRRALVAAQLLHLDLQFADWTDFERRREELVATVATLEQQPGESVPPYVLLALCDDAELQAAAARRWAWPASGERAGAAGAPTRADAPLRLGFVASAFHDHPVPRLLVELLERLDRARYRIHAYALGRGASDALRLRVERGVDAFVELGHLATADAVARIRADDIELLFDLTGHTGQARPDVFAARPAPVQVNYLGYAGTLGASYWDYVLTDGYTTPPGEQQHFSERFCYLGACYLPSDTRRVLDVPPPARADYGLPESAFVFVTQAAAYKILPPLFAVWMRLLASVADAVLWLRPHDARAQANLRAEAKRRGIDPGRLIFAPQDGAARYLARYALADLFLDTYPFGSHTTVNDALFAGLPVLTLAGRSMAARASAAQLLAAGLPELVAASFDQYEAIARDLAGNRQRLQALRRRLDARDAPLFDMVAYTRTFEAALERMASAAGLRAGAAAQGATRA
jgi:protein O-GlcNAc transferase